MLRFFLPLFLSCSCAWAEVLPQAVITTTAKELHLKERITGVGTFTPYNDVIIKAETEGRIEAIHFKEGDRAKPGQLLFTLYNKEQESRVKKAEATLKLSKSILNRKQELMEKKFVAPQDLEQAATQVESNKADLDLTKAELEKTKIKAPFDGVLSARQVSKGAYVAEGDELVRLQDITPMRFIFQISEKEIPLIKIGEKITVTTDVYPEQTFGGKIEAIEPSINEETRSVSVYAVFENKEEKLIPGLYGRSQLTLSTHAKASLFIPEQALVVRPNGMHVYKKENNKVLLVKITLGRRFADQAEILSGLNKGDQIVLEGQDKIHDGSLITVTERQ